MLWGIEIEASLYRVNERPRDLYVRVHALWSTVMSQWAVNVASEILA